MTILSYIVIFFLFQKEQNKAYLYEKKNKIGKPNLKIILEIQGY